MENEIEPDYQQLFNEEDLQNENPNVVENRDADDDDMPFEFPSDDYMLLEKVFNKYFIKIIYLNYSQLFNS